MTTPTVTEIAQAAARQLWDSFTRSERRGIAFGLFPHRQIQAAVAAGVDSHALVVALTQLASSTSLPRTNP